MKSIDRTAEITREVVKERQQIKNPTKVWMIEGSKVTGLSTPKYSVNWDPTNKLTATRKQLPLFSYS